MSEVDDAIDQIESHAALYREQQLRAEIERLRALLHDALPFVNDAGTDEDPEASRHATETADAIRRALGRQAR